ncbi:hypothetical protein Nepgr_031299 [Nepenthes gracilis]|uniref:Bromo domain-containing protein n=1 Tax=Nepenthes gracilis TaxID=150966 RepID=A0AAD3THU8_NEPGR|nr:hypothetical protein Nepgr_031299 [Nepenthes gracilis]
MSQRTTQYMNLIRQHIDLQTIRTRLDEGRYSDHHANFYRDLLLLINNAVVFFPKKSSEHKAAVELRQLVSKRLPRSAAKQGPEQHLTKREREAEDSLLFKPKISMPVIVCRKRSSTVAKASVGGRKRGEAVLIGNDEKKQRAAGDAKKPEKSTSISAVTKQRTMDQGFDSRNSSRNGKSQICDPPNKSSEKQATSGPKVLGIDGASGNENSEATLEKKNSKSNARTVNSKKQGAANFLNRIRRNLSPNDAFLSDSMKKSAVNADNGKGSEQKKNSSGHNNYKSEGSRDHSSRKGSGSKAAKEMQRGGVAKKDNAGRSLMRVVATTATRQRRRAHGEAESVPKKRQRK